MEPVLEFRIHRVVHISYSVIVVLVAVLKLISHRKGKWWPKHYKTVSRAWLLMGIIETTAAVDGFGVFGIYPYEVSIFMDNFSGLLTFLTVNETLFYIIESSKRGVDLHRRALKRGKLLIIFALVFVELGIHVVLTLLLRKLIIRGIGFLFEILIISAMAIVAVKQINNIRRSVIDMRTSTEESFNREEMTAELNRRIFIIAVMASLIVLIFAVGMMEIFLEPLSTPIPIPIPGKYLPSYIVNPVAKAVVVMCWFWKFTVPICSKRSRQKAANSRTQRSGVTSHTLTNTQKSGRELVTSQVSLHASQNSMAVRM